ncbi:hypothetical protein SNE40_004029 [Patella caerulea]|uniref:Uncharacterized protein n=1 Tax=Patella caerulea TaxID=87958 RepID=A0AAN8KFI9_PATCE
MSRCTAPFLFLLLLVALLQLSSARPKSMTWRLLGNLKADDAQDEHYEYEFDDDHGEDRENSSNDVDDEWDDDDDDDESKEAGVEISKALVERGDISSVGDVMGGFDDVYDDDDYEDSDEGDVERGTKVIPFNEYVERGYIYHKTGEVSKSAEDDVGDDAYDVESKEYGDIEHDDYDESKMSHEYYRTNNLINYDEDFDDDEDDYNESNMSHEDSGINNFINDEEYVDDEDDVDDDDDSRSEITSEEEGINNLLDFDEVDFESTKNNVLCFGRWC